MRNTRNITDIEEFLAVQAHLPYSRNGEYVELDYTSSLIGNLSRHIDGNGCFPDVRSSCSGFLEIFHELTMIFNDEKIKDRFEIDFDRNVFSNGPLPRICYLVSCLQNSLFIQYLRILSQKNIEPEKIKQLQFIIWLVNEAWSYVLSGESSEFFNADIRCTLEELVDGKKLVDLEAVAL